MPNLKTKCPIGFDKLIVKFCADETITVEQRIAKIKEFIKVSTIS